MPENDLLKNDHRATPQRVAPKTLGGDPQMFGTNKLSGFIGWHRGALLRVALALRLSLGGGLGDTVGPPHHRPQGGDWQLEEGGGRRGAPAEAAPAAAMGSGAVLAGPLGCCAAAGRPLLIADGTGGKG